MRAEHPGNEREAPLLVAGNTIDGDRDFFGARLPDRDRRGARETRERAHVRAVRSRDVHEIRGKAAQDRDREIEPIRRDRAQQAFDDGPATSTP
jgi:hypothetical protein